MSDTLLTRCEQERDQAKREVRRLRDAVKRWEKYASYIEGKQIVAPLWDNILFDAARQAGLKALKKPQRGVRPAAPGKGAT